MIGYRTDMEPNYWLCGEPRATVLFFKTRLLLSLLSELFMIAEPFHDIFSLFLCR